MNKHEQIILNNYRDLGTAIIGQACEDYLFLLRTKRGTYKVPHNASRSIKELEVFFKSQWFDLLADDIDGETLMAMLRKKVEQESENGRNTLL